MGNISKPTAIQAERIEDMNTKLAKLFKKNITKEIIMDDLLHHYCIKHCNCKAFGLDQTT